MRVNGKSAFVYNDYPLIYAIEPLVAFDPNSVHYIGEESLLCNLVICSVMLGVDDNKCFLFTNAEMYKVAEEGLLPFLAESFSIGSFIVSTVAVREDFIVLGTGSSE